MPKIIFFLAPLLLCTNAWALKTDNQQPMTFIANQTLYNHKTNTTQLIGNVQMQQGSTHLTADQVTFYAKDGKINKMVAIGKPAHYTSLGDNQPKPMDVWGKTIEYYPNEKKAVIIGDALYVQGETRFSGSYITYDLDKKRVVSLPKDAKTKSILIVQPQDLPRENANAHSPSPQS